MLRPLRMIQIRGTSGAGKTTLMRAIMAQYCHPLPLLVAGRKQPLGYFLRPSTDERPPLFVPGHYESACGGCDTLGKFIPDLTVTLPDGRSQQVTGLAGNSYDLIFPLIKSLYTANFDVLFEGLLISGDVARCLDLNRMFPLQVVCINLPVQECIDSVLERRRAAGNTKPFNEDNTRDKHKLMQNCIKKLKAGGVSVLDCPTRESARIAVATSLGLIPPDACNASQFDSYA